MGLRLVLQNMIARSSNGFKGVVLRFKRKVRVSTTHSVRVCVLRVGGCSGSFPRLSVRLCTTVAEFSCLVLVDNTSSANVYSKVSQGDRCA